MSERVNHLMPYVITLKNLRPRQRKVVLGLVSKEQIRAFEEVAINIIKNTVSLTPEQEKTCRRWRRPLRLLALKRYPVKEKKHILQQGGFFGAILPIIASVLGSLITSNV